MSTHDEPAQRPVVARTVARGGLAFVFAYHGLVPKLLGPHPDELAPLLDAGFSDDAAQKMVFAAGVLELLLACAFVVFWRRKWPSWVALVFLVGALAGVALTTPRLLTGAFNPVSLNLAAACLATIDLLLLGAARRTSP